MADIFLRDVLLFDQWPGVPDPNLSCPTEGFDASTQCSSTPVWPLGTKIQNYNDSTYGPGYYTMIYLMFCETSVHAYDIDDPSTGYNMCFHVNDVCDNIPGNSDAANYWYIVTNDLTSSDGTLGGALAFAAYDLSGNSGTTESNECGWFWCGGVNPCITDSATNTADCTRLAGEIRTDGSVTQGKLFGIGDDGSEGGALYAFDNSTTNAAVPVGIALKDDN